jgi:hypothetical protein
VGSELSIRDRIRTYFYPEEKTWKNAASQGRERAVKRGENLKKCRTPEGSPQTRFIALLHQAMFAETHFYTNQLLHKPLLHKLAFHKQPFTPSSPYTNELLYKPASPQTNFSTNQLLHKPRFAPSNFYILASTRTTFSTNQPFTPTSFTQPALGL